MNQTPISLSFNVMMAVVLVWFAMIIVLFKRLKSRHQEKYNDMGNPDLFCNNNLKTGWAFVKFLFKREHKDLHDGFLSFLSDVMLVFLVINVVLSIGLFLGFIKVASSG